MNIIRMITVAVVFILLPALAQAQLIEWRGPNRTGVYPETGLLKSWPKGGPKLLWEAGDLGDGYSSATVTDDAVYVTGRKDEVDVLTALTLSGNKKWDIVYGKAWTRNHTGTRGIPTYYSGDIFLVSGAGELACISSSGKIRWKRNHYELYGGRPLRFGISESPVVHDNKVIVSPGRDKASLVAFNIADGSIAWEAETLNEGPQYVNPLLVDHNGRNLIVTLTDTYIIGVDADTGKLLWKVHYKDVSDASSWSHNHTNTPLYKNGRIFVANGYGYFAVMLELSKDGSAAKFVWKNKDIGPHHGGMVVLGDYIYSSNHISNSMGDWICVDWNTGKTMWKKRWNNKGSIISADGMLYLYEERSGNVGLVNPTPDKFDLVSTFKVTKGDGPHWAHPVIRHGKLYLRHGEMLMVYSIKSKR